MLETHITCYSILILPFIFLQEFDMYHRFKLIEYLM